jgi:hypothetical protein
MVIEKWNNFDLFNVSVRDRSAFFSILWLRFSDNLRRLGLKLKESSSTLYNKPLEDNNPCRVIALADVVGMIKECTEHNNHLEHQIPSQCLKFRVNAKENFEINSYAATLTSHK